MSRVWRSIDARFSSHITTKNDWFVWFGRCGHLCGRCDYNQPCCFCAGRHTTECLDCDYRRRFAGRK